MDLLVQIGDREPELISLSDSGEGQWRIHRVAENMPIVEGPVDLVFMVNKGRIELDWLEFTEAR